MSSQRLPRRVLFADARTGCKKRRGVQCMIWCRGMKESCKGLTSVGASRLSCWGPRVDTAVVSDVIRYGSE
ncbi:unnamed protein product [Schistosoma curassoni]|uniref:Uncharacterized protein n=1 Tax=Schistosoma curassoni TaxID=6186 RepID=A0A183JTL6_9TREM|nr:unnamed protein product [Schistosoma curassoni]